MDILSTARIPSTSPSDIMLLPNHLPLSADGGRSGVAVARVNQPTLTIWLCRAINSVLLGVPTEQPRPPGLLFERGTFGHDGAQVWAEAWYSSRRRVAVATCADDAAARVLIGQLNRLLGGTPELARRCHIRDVSS